MTACIRKKVTEKQGLASAGGRRHLSHAGAFGLKPLLKRMTMLPRVAVHWAPGAV